MPLPLALTGLALVFALLALVLAIVLSDEPDPPPTLDTCPSCDGYGTLPELAAGQWPRLQCPTCEGTGRWSVH